MIGVYMIREGIFENKTKLKIYWLTISFLSLYMQIHFSVLATIEAKEMFFGQETYYKQIGVQGI